MTTTNTAHLTTLAAVSFIGKDAAHFLQGQLTINTEALAAGKWQRAAYCSRQGRIIAGGILAHLPADEPHFMFIISTDIAAVTADMLKRYLLRAKVNIEQPPAHITAANAPATPPPAAAGNVSSDNGTVIIDEADGKQLIISAAPVSAEASETVWQQAEIQRGIPWISAATQDSQIPQFINYELLGGVDFNKGCYVGQEVISRLHHLGEVKRRGMIISGSGQAAAGDILKNAADKPAGEIINSAAQADGFIAFAAVARNAADELTLNGARLQVQPPPYPIIEQEKFKRR